MSSRRSNTVKQEEVIRMTMELDYPKLSIIHFQTRSFTGKLRINVDKYMIIF
jgi:hypothetical protein